MLDMLLDSGLWCKATCSVPVGLCESTEPGVQVKDLAYCSSSYLSSY